MILQPRDAEIAAAVAVERAKYLRLLKEAPEPVVINIDAVLAIGQSREFAWGARKLRAPPLSYAQGIRLLVAANALRDLRDKQAPPKVVQAALTLAATLIRQTVKPRHWWHGLRWSRAFTQDDAESIEGLLRWLTDIPDQSAPPKPATRQVTVDLMDVLAEFARDFPAWVGADGFPRSWAHYLYGLRHMSRAVAREDLRHSAAARASQYETKDYNEFAREMRQAAGW